MKLLDIIILSLCFVGLIVFFIVLYILTHRKYRVVRYDKRLYVGDTGAGKTSLVIAQAIWFHYNCSDLVLRDIYPYFEKMKNEDFPNIELPDTFIASDTTLIVEMDKEGNDLIKATDCDFYKLQIPTEDNFKDIDYYSFGSYFIFDEIQNKAQSREFKNLSSNVARLLNYNRKMFWNMRFLAPRLEDVDALIRRACDILVSVVDKVDKYDKKGNLIETTWYFIEYSGANREENCKNGVTNNARFKEYQMYIPYRKRRPIEKWYFTFKGNIFKHYDSFREMLYFLNHLTKFKNKKTERFCPTRANARDFLKEHPLFVDKDNRTISEKRKGG